MLKTVFQLHELQGRRPISDGEVTNFGYFRNHPRTCPNYLNRFKID